MGCRGRHHGRHVPENSESGKGLCRAMSRYLWLNGSTVFGGMNTRAFSYKHHRFPPQIIARAVWLYFRFPLSLRFFEEMLLERDIVVSYETV